MHKILKSTVILSIGSILARVLGLLFIFYFPRYVDKEHLGFYSYCYSYLVLFLDFSLLGIPSSLQKIIVKYQETNQAMINQLVKRVLKIVFILSLIALLMMFLFSNLYIKKTGMLEYQLILKRGILIILISCVTNSLMVTLRSYFQAFNKMSVSAISLIIEQVSRILFIILAVIFFKSNQNILVYAALLACTVGQLMALIYLFFSYFKNRGRNTVEVPVFIYRELVSYAFFIFLTIIFISTSNIIDAVTFKKALELHNVNDASDIYALYTFQINRILFFPIILATSMATSLITNAFKMDKKDIKKVLQLVFKVLFYFVVFFIFFSPKIYSLLFEHNELAFRMLKYASILILCYGFYYIMLALLIAFEKIKFLAPYIILSLVVKVSLNHVLITKMSYIGAILVNVMMYGILLFGSFFILRKYIDKWLYASFIKDALLIITSIIVTAFFFPDKELSFFLQGLSLLSCLVVSLGILCFFDFIWRTFVQKGLLMNR